MHDILSEALLVGRERLEERSNLDMFLKTIATSLTEIRKVALDEN